MSHYIEQTTHDHDQVLLNLKKKHEDSKHVDVKIYSKDFTAKIGISPLRSFKDIKTLLEDETGISSSKQCLYYKGKKVADNTNLIDEGFHHKHDVEYDLQFSVERNDIGLKRKIITAEDEE